MTSQIRGSSSSIAEGFGRRKAELARFLQIGMGSASELEYHILLSRDLNFVKETVYEQLEQRVVEVKRMLAALLVKVRSDR